MDLGIVQQVLSSGGDVATIALLGVMWRFDRRLLIVETKILKGN